MYFLKIFIPSMVAYVGLIFHLVFFQCSVTYGAEKTQAFIFSAIGW